MDEQSIRQLHEDANHRPTWGEVQDLLILLDNERKNVAYWTGRYKDSFGESVVLQREINRLKRRIGHDPRT